MLDRANKQIFYDFIINVFDCITISGLAVKVFLTNFYENNTPVIDKPSMYHNITQAYYGGITEVYRPYGKKRRYYIQ